MNLIGSPEYKPAIYISSIIGSFLIWTSIVNQWSWILAPILSLIGFAALTFLGAKFSQLDLKTSSGYSALFFLTLPNLFMFTNNYLEIYSSSLMLQIILFFALIHFIFGTEEFRQRFYFLRYIIICVAGLLLLAHLGNIFFTIFAIVLVPNFNQKIFYLFLFFIFMTTYLILRISKWDLIPANIFGGSDGKYFAEISDLMQEFWNIFLVNSTIVLVSLILLVFLIMDFNKKVFFSKFHLYF